MKPKLLHFTFYVFNNCRRKSTLKFGLILNSSWTNEKSKGQILMKIYGLDINGKLIEQGISRFKITRLLKSHSLMSKKAKLTNFMKLVLIEGYNGKDGSNP